MKLHVTRKKYKPFKFGVLSALALGSVLLGQVATKATSTAMAISLAAVALVAGGTSAALLYYLFNKR